MIASLQGRVIASGENWVVVNVSGVGFRVYVPRVLAESLAGVGHDVQLYTHLHVRENEVALFGFAALDDLSLFELLLGVSGIGPRGALRIMSSISTDALREAIGHGDAAALTHIPGVGRKTADRLLVDLRDKLSAGAVSSFVPVSHADAEVIEALTSLGYSLAEAQAAFRSLPREDMPLEERVRLALQYFSPR